MKLRAFLDTNVFVYAFEFPDSNSKLIIDSLNSGSFEAVVSQAVLAEVTRYFRKFHSKELSAKFRHYLFESCTLVLHSDIENTMHDYADQVKDKDLEQLAVVKQYGLKYLVSLDRDFEPFEEYLTPKQFAEVLELEIKDTVF